MTNSIKLPVWYWIIGVVALIWNILGVVAYLGQAYMTDEAMATLPEADQAMYSNMPAWVTAAFAIAVFAGLLGCIALLLRKKWATLLFLISFIAVLAQQVYSFFIQDYIELSGARLVWPIIIIIIAALLYWFAKGAEQKGWIK